jgi:stage 0 sporulation regulatory protein
MEDGSKMRSIDKKVILLGHIKLKQKIMYNKAQKLGRTHSSVILCSQELDILLNKYQDLQMAENHYSKVS